MGVLSIIIPAYNEAKTIHLILDKVKAVKLIGDLEKEVIIVNDCSSDKTEDAIRDYAALNKEMNLRLISHEVNKGKGAALHTGIREAHGDYLIIQDADLEYDPEEYNLLLKPILDGAADAVYGSRFMGGNPHRILFFWHTIGNKFLTFLSNMFSNLNLTDMETCYKLFKSDIIKNIPLQENRFGFEPEVTQKISRIKGIRLYEVGISYYGRTYEEGKKISWKDGFRALYCILKYGLARDRNSGSTPSASTTNRGKKWVWLISAFVVFMFFNIRLGSNDFYRGQYSNIFHSDGLCYYQYLTASFIHNDLLKRMDYAIYLQDGTKFNKYTWGTAYMQAPFFLAAHGYAKLTGQSSSGYSNLYGTFIATGAMIYAFLALCLVFFILRRYVSRAISFFTVLLLYFSTNLLFYTLGEPAMSHVYSFFLITVIIYYTPAFLQKATLKNTLLVGIPLAIAILIRPTNLVIGFYLIFFDIKNFSDLAQRIRYFLRHWYMILLMLGVSIIVFIPQMIYWHMTIGQWFVYSYKFSVGRVEGFSYWKNPQIFNVLFGVVSGWLVYSPVMIVSLVGLIWMLIKKWKGSLAITVVFLVILYLNASWWMYTFSCAFGYRSFIEYYSLFAIPVALLLNKLLPDGKYIRRGVFIVLAVFFSYMNIRMSLIYSWDPCWYGESWTWRNYEKVLKSAVRGGSCNVNVHQLEETNQ